MYKIQQLMDCLLFFRKIDVNLIDLVEWAIATHGMYESPFCVGNVHSLSYFQFQAALSVT